jgi:hypothetical protein
MRFEVIPASNYIWNRLELIDFLVQNQGQNIVLTTKSEGCCCRAIGLYDLLGKFSFKSVTIISPNQLEHHKQYHINIHAPWKFFTVSNTIDTLYHTWNKNKVFATIYGRPLWHRIGLVAHLKKYYSDISLLGCLADPGSSDNRELFEVSRLFRHDPHSLQNFAEIWKQLPMALHNVAEYTPGQQLSDGYIAQTKNLYPNFLIDIVAEPFTDGDCFFATEKTVRPMMLKKPFILMGSKNHLNYLHQMGFRTFSDFWNEDYDGYEGKERYSKILNLIDILAQKSIAELEHMYWDMQYTLDYNYNLLLTQTYNKIITEKIP